VDDAINAVLPSILASLNGVPLYDRDPAKLKRQSPDLPYALLLPVSEPADPNIFDSAAIFGLNVWGPYPTVSGIRHSLQWLRRYEVGRYGDAQNIRYRLWTRSFDPAPDHLMPDGATQVWNLSTTYRAQYFHASVGAPP
jgi:hypothetical protein